MEDKHKHLEMIQDKKNDNKKILKKAKLAH